MDINLLASAINGEQIVSIIQLAANIAFYSLLGILVIAFLWGLLQGWRYGTYHMVFLGLLVALGLVTLSPVVDAISGFDLSGIITQPITVQIQEHAITVNVTTLSDTLTSFFDQLLRSYGVAASSEDIVAYAQALTGSALKLVLIFAEGLIIATVGSLLVWLLWHVCFKFIFARKRPVQTYPNGDSSEPVVVKRRPKRKLRLVSGIEQLAVAAVCMAMIVAPLSSVVNTISKNLDVDKDASEQDETVGLVYDCLDAYENSIFAKVFFSVETQDGTQTIDSQLISFLTSTNSGEIKTDVLSELASIAEVGTSVINSGLLSMFSADGTKWSTLIASTLIPTLLQQVASVELVRVALPIAVSIALNMDQVKSILGEDAVSYISSADYDYGDELENLSDFYVDLLDSGFFDVIVDEVSKTPIIDLKQLFSIFRDQDAYDAFHSALSKADSDFINHLLAGAVYTMATKDGAAPQEGELSLASFLPSGQDGSISYQKVAEMKWFDELGLIYDAFYSLVSIDKEQMEGLFDELPTIGGNSSAKAANPNEAGQSGTILDKALNFVVDHSAEIVEIIVGKRDASGNPVEVGEDGISTSRKSLLDSQLLGNALDDLLPFAQKQLDGANLPFDLDLSEAESELVGQDVGETRVNFKRELGSILDIVSDFASTESGKAFLLDIKGLEGINFDPDGKLYSIDEGLLDALIDCLPLADRSVILSSNLPKIAEGALENVPLQEYGIEQLDFGCDSLGEEISKLLKIAKYCPTLVSSFAKFESMGTSTMTSLIAEAKGEFAYILDAILSSKIINPVIDGKQNVNFCNLINALMEKVGDAVSFDPIAPEDLPSNLTSVYDDDGNIVSKGETYYLVDALCSVVGSGIIENLSSITGGDANQAVSALSRVDIASVFESIGDSQLLSRMAGQALDGYIIKPLFGEDTEGVSFTNITDWKAEGEAIESIIALAAKGIDLSNLDFFAIGPNVGELLTRLADSGIFVSREGEYLFPKFLYNKLVGSLSGGALSYFLDPDDEVDPNGLTTLEQKKEHTKLLYHDLVESLSSREDWTGEDGEISKVSDILDAISSLGGLSDEASTKEIDFSSINSAFFLHFEGEDLSLGYPSLTDDDMAENQEEIETLFAALDVIFDPSYGIYKDGQVNLNDMNLASINSEFQLRPLLESASSSKLLSTAEEGKRPVFKQLVDYVLAASTIYGEQEAGQDYEEFLSSPINEYTKQSIRSIVDGVGQDEWDLEISIICDIVDSVQKSGLINPEGGFDLESVSDPATFFGTGAQKQGKVDSLKSILNDLNSSTLFYRAIPTMLEKAFKGDNNGHSHLFGDASFANNFLNYADPFFGAAKGGEDYLSYPEGETDNLVDMLADLAECSDFTLNDLSTIDSSAITDALQRMMESHVFNQTIGEEGVTSFQYLVSDLLCFDAIKGYLYLDESPKDRALESEYAAFYNPADYGDADVRAKARYLVSTTMPSLGKDGASEASLAKGNEAIASLGEVLSLLQSDEMYSIVSDGTLDINAIRPSVFASFLTTLNDSPLFYDLVPNIIFTMVNSGESFAIEGIDFSSANVFYQYYQQDGKARVGGPDFTARYDDSEIYLLSSALSYIGRNSDLFSSAGLADLSTLDPLVLRSILVDMENSYIFNLPFSSAYLSDSGLALGASWTEAGYVYNDLTVFEQLMYLIYDDTGLASASFSMRDYLSIYLDHPADGYKQMLHDSILSFRDESAHSWGQEINSLTTDGRGGGLLDLVLNSDLVDEEGNLSLDSLTSIDPDTLAGFMERAAKLNVVPNLLPNKLGQVFEQVDLGKFTTATADFAADEDGYFELTPFVTGGGRAISLTADSVSQNDALLYVDGLNEPIDLSAEGLVDGNSVDLSEFASSSRIRLEPNEQLTLTYDLSDYHFTQQNLRDVDIDLIRNLLYSIYDERNGAYITFEGDTPLKNLLDAGLESLALLEFYQQSTIFDKEYSAEGLLPADSGAADPIEARDYAMYSIFTVNQTIDFGSGVVIPVQVSLFSHLDLDDVGMAGSLLTLRSLIGQREDGSYPDLTGDAAYLDNNLISIIALEGYAGAVSTMLETLSGDTAAIAIKAINSTFQSPDVVVAGQNVGFTTVASAFYVADLWKQDKPTFFQYILAGEIESITANLLSYLECSKLFSISLGDGIEIPSGPSRLEAYGRQDAASALSFATDIDDLSKVVDGTYADPFYKACMVFGKSDDNPDYDRAQTLDEFVDYAGQQKDLADLLYLGLIYDSTRHDRDGDFMAYVTNEVGSPNKLNYMGGQKMWFSYASAAGLLL